MTDGYSEEMLALVLERTKLIQRAHDIDAEIRTYPRLPDNFGTWIDSISKIELTKRTFGLQDLGKLTKLNRELARLQEKEDVIASKIRVYMIENTLSSIKDIKGNA